MATKAKVTFTQKVRNKTISTPVEFISWNGRPQLPRPVIDRTTRLGGNQFVVSVQKTEAVMTSANATIVGNTFTDVENKVKTILSNMGVRGTWIDESGVIVDNFYIFDMTYNIKAISSGDYQYIAYCNIICSTDSTPASTKRVK